MTLARIYVTKKCIDKALHKKLYSDLLKNICVCVCVKMLKYEKINSISVSNDISNNSSKDIV